MKLSDFDYSLPPERIAQRPTERREDARLLVVGRSDGSRKHARFAQVGQWLRRGDLLVLNAGDDVNLVVNLDRADDWAPWADTLDPESIVAAIDAVQRAADKLRGALQPNARLTVEEALIGAGAALRSGMAA